MRARPTHRRARRARWPAVCVVGLLLLAAAAPPAGGVASTAPSTATVGPLAVAQPTPPGPEPRGPHDPDNPAAPPPYQRPWTYLLGVLLTIVVGLVVVWVAVVYWLRVRRAPPAGRRPGASRSGAAP